MSKISGTQQLKNVLTSSMSREEAATALKDV